MASPLTLALLSCAALGLRHGFDYDHLAAITDITSVQRGWRQGMGLGLLYALGHAATVAALGLAVVIFRVSLPGHLDAVGERLVGATLLALTAYILWAFFQGRGHAHPVSRAALLARGAQWVGWRARRLRDPQAVRPEPFRFGYQGGSVFGVGVVHGLGAETPSQLLLFLLAANLGGPSRGVAGLGCFIAGLLIMNTLMTASASGLFLSSARRRWAQGAVTLLTAAYSGAIGTIFVFGASDRLPALVR